MTNKLEEYRDESAYGEVDYKLGFDAAIALDLSVKFAEWKENNCVFHHGQWFLSSMSLPLHNNGIICIDNKGLFQYWIENIFKIE